MAVYRREQPTSSPRIPHPDGSRGRAGRALGGVGAWETAMMWGNRKRRPECMPVPSPMEDTGSPPDRGNPREELTTRPLPLGRDGD